MTNIGDFRLGDTFDHKFCTVTTTGAPTTLAGTPVVSAYVGNSVTQLTAGITLSVDFDGVTGLHNVRVVASGGNGYATASNYQLVITTGTVGGTSVVGYVIGVFSIENRSALMPTVAARTLDVTATGGAGIDWANVEAPTTALALTGTTIAVTQKVDVDTIKTNPVVNGGTITFPTTATLASTTNITAGTVTTATNVTTVNGLAAAVITAASIAADAITDAKVAADVTIASVTGAVGSVTGAVGSVTGAVGSVTGAVGSVTGNVGGNVVGAVGSVTGNVGGSVASIAAAGISSSSFAAAAIDAAAIAADAIGSSELAASAASEIATAVGALTASEPTGVTSANPNLIAAIAWLHTLSRNKILQTATTQTLKADDGSTTIAASTISDDGTTATRNEFA